MNCIEFEAALERGIETREPLVSSAIEHAAVCSDCRIDWDIHRQLDAVIAVWRPVEPPLNLVDSDFADSVLAELTMPIVTNGLLANMVMNGHRATPVQSNSRTSASVPRGRSSGFAIASVAVCLFIAVISTTQHTRRNSLDLARADRARITVRASSQSSLDVSQTLTAVISDLRSEYREMAAETTLVARNLVNAIPHHIPVTIRSDPDEIQPRPRSSAVARIWLPIGNRVESALGFLWQAVPSEVPSG